MNKFYHRFMNSWLPILLLVYTILYVGRTLLVKPDSPFFYGFISLFVGMIFVLTLQLRRFLASQCEPLDSSQDLSLKGILAQKGIPQSINVWRLIPFTFFWILLTGVVMNFPPGPLCDEGMIAFMEGSCDYGGSNIFFFSKLGIWLAINVCFIEVLRHPTVKFFYFVPHVILSLILAIFLNGATQCSDSYYGHPQPMFIQTVIQLLALSGLMMTIASRARQNWGANFKLILLVLVNSLHVAVFYIAMLLSPYWSWNHTWMMVAIHIGLAFLVLKTTLISNLKS